MTAREPKWWRLFDALDELRPRPLPEDGFAKLAAEHEKLQRIMRQIDLREALDMLCNPEPLPPPPPQRALPAPPPKRKRKKGGGAPNKLTDDAITSGQEIVRNALRRNPRLAKKTTDDLVVHFRPRFKLKGKVSDRTLWRHIIGPVVGPRRTK